MRNLIFTSIFLIFSTTVFAQNLEVISSAGDYFAPAGSDITISWTLGEPVIETFAPAGSNVILTQGFQQPSSITKPGTFKIQGYVYYDNNKMPKTIMTNTQLILLNEEMQPVGTVNTDQTGFYSFINIPVGNYTLQISTTKKPGGINTTDALLVNRYFVKLVTFKDNLVKSAADVNASSGSVNTTDALLINQRFVKIINTFIKKGDWVFDNPAINVINADINLNINALCVGDVNYDFNVPLKNLTSSVTLQTFGIKTIEKNKDFELPVSVSRNINLGSAGLVIKYPAKDFIVKEIISDLKDLVYNIQKDEIRIAWADASGKGKDFIANEVIFKIKMHPVNFSEENHLYLSNESELSDFSANVFSGEVLFIPALNFNEGNNAFFLAQNYPNPFKNSTAIDYYLPEDANVSLRIFNMLGELVSEEFNRQQDAGYYTHNFNASLAEGVYMYELKAKNNNTEFNKTRLMVVNFGN